MAKKKQSKVQQFIKKFKSRSLRYKLVAGVGSLAALGALMVILLVVSVRFGMFGKLPTHRELTAVQNPESTLIYSADDKVIGKFFTKNRTNISIDAISPFLTDALVATEDSRFYEHNGIDFRAWMRVLVKTVIMRNRSSGGGSTITQQLAKNLFPRKHYSVLSIPVNKIREFIIAKRLEKIYSKQQVLNLYLNTVPFGGNIFGVQVAAKQLFGTNSRDIKQEDAAVLIGMLKANTKYHPAKNPKNSLQRRNVVLSQLAKYGYMDEAVRDSLSKLPLVTDYKKESVSAGLATYFREQIRQDAKEILEDNNLEEEYNLYTSGLRIYTTLDSRLQKFAENAMESHLASLQKTYDEHWKGMSNLTKTDLQPFIERSDRYQRMKSAGASMKVIEKVFDTPVSMEIFDWKEGEKQVELSPMDSIKYYVNLLNTGFLAANPKNGNILAWIGGISHKHIQYDHVKSRRPVGSTFKPFVYANALLQGQAPCGYLYNRLVTYTDYDDWQPQNADGNYSGVYSMEGGLTNSVNSISVNLITEYGIDKTISLAQKMGIKSAIPAVPSIALGTAELPLYEMVNAYACLANEGVKPALKYLLRIEDKNGKVIWPEESDLKDEEFKVEPDQALDSLTNRMIVHMMESVVDNGTGRRLRGTYGLTGAMAGKTGTTQNHSDGWFIGYTPDIVAGVWVGGASPKVRFRSLNLGAGGNMALPIWGKFMQSALKDRAFADWKSSTFPVMPESIIQDMNCEHYQEEMPIFVDNDENIDELEPSEFEKKIDAFFEDIFEKDKKERPSTERSKSQKTSKSKTSRSRQSEEIRKRNEKTRRQKVRKKKQKDFFKKIFGDG